MSITLETPVLLNIKTFDPAYDTNIDFSYNGVQIVRKRLVITDSSGTIVLDDDRQIGIRTRCFINKNTLTPGRQYTAQVQVFDKENGGNSSELSAPSLFYCYTTPSLKFINLNRTVSDGSITLNVEYSQIEDEKLKEYVFYLYDYTGTLIQQSSTFYSTDNMSFSFYGLKNETQYYVRCAGRTVTGMDCDTGKEQISVRYVAIPNNMTVDLINHRCEGYITISCNIIDIGYSFDNSHYTISDGKLTLGDEDSDNSLSYDSGFSFDDDFSVFLKAKSLKVDKTFLKMYTSDGAVELSIKKIAGDYYCVLEATASIDKYYKYIKLNNNDIVHDKYASDRIMVYELKRKNYFYNLKIYAES